MQQSLFSCFEKTASRLAGKIAIKYITDTEEACITYSKLLDESIKISEILATYSCKHLLFVMDDQINQIILIMAAIRCEIPFLIIDKDFIPSSAINNFNLESEIIITDNVNLQAKLKGTALLYNALRMVAAEQSTPDLKIKGRPPIYYIPFFYENGKIDKVSIYHDSILQYILYRNSKYNIREEDTILQLLSPVHSGYYANFFSALFSGATMVIASNASKNIVLDCFFKDAVTQITIIPYMLHGLLKLGGKEDFKQLRQVAFYGEECKEETIMRLKQYSPHIMISNEYHIAEYNIPVSIKTNLEIDDIQNIGYPLPGWQIDILDESLHPVKEENTGRFYVKGQYKNDKLQSSTLEAENEVLNKIYETKDYGKRLKNGEFTVVYHVPGQVIITGCSLNIYKLEEVLCSIDEISVIHIFLNEDSEEHYLEAFIIKKRNVAWKEIIDKIQKKIPGFMIPRFFYEINHEYDKDRTLSYKEFLNISTPLLMGNQHFSEDSVEQQVYIIWTQVLKTNHIGLHDNFFDIGGNSFLITLVHEKINRLFRINITFMDLYRYHTIYDLSNYIKSFKNI